MGAYQGYPAQSAFRTVLGILALAACVIAQVPNAPPRPSCTSLTGPGSCDWKATNGVGPGVRVVLSDRTGGHEQSKMYLREALTRLSVKYGFTLTRIESLNDITDTYLQNAKVIIFSSGDGTSGGSIPNATVRTRVEKFVKESGWGLIMIHAACAFIKSWPFQEQACVQQYNHMNGAGTSATILAENRVLDGIGHGRVNPHTAFLLAGLPDSVRMTDELYTWIQAPRTTAQVGDVAIKNLTMLLRMNESSLLAGIAPANPTFGTDHHLMWTHTQGNGITIFQSLGHDNIYTQDGVRRAYGDSLLWREIRYAAKDWDTISAPTAISSQIRSRFSLSGVSGSILLSLGNTPHVSVSITDIAGRQVYAHAFHGEKTAEIKGLKRGIYFVKLAAGGMQETGKITLY
jgi:hypothetical protein